jgi:cell division protein ZapA
MPDVSLTIAGRSYRVACRQGEEDSLREAAALVDSKSRDVIAGLGTQSEARQLLLAALLLADQLIDKPALADDPAPPPPAPAPDPELAQRAGSIATRLEALADALEQEARNP